MKVISSEEMKKIDQQCVEEGMLDLTLMENAGQGFVEVLKNKILNLRNNKVLILAGKGNNGGDGLVVARRLMEEGCEVKIILLAKIEELTKNTKVNLERIKNTNINFLEYSKGTHNLLKEEIEKTDLIVDAIFGTGFKSNIPESIIELFELINKADKFVAACDIPSGINGTTGEVSNICIDADLTITFGLPKRGLFLFPGTNFTGEINIVDIGIPGSIIEKADTKEELLDLEKIKFFLPDRKRKNVCKNNFGHVLVLAGSKGMTGAAYLTCQGALYAGAGLVTLALPESISRIMEIKLTEAMTLPLPEADGKLLTVKSFEKICEFIEKRKISLLAIGPGLSINEKMGELIEKIILAVKAPCILDADGLNVLVGKDKIFKQTKAKLIITPHPGELGRLMGKSSSEVQKSRIDCAKKFAKENRLICVLKGHHTVISDGDIVHFNATGNPGMATAGMGDILTGMIAGLLAQNIVKSYTKNLFCLDEILLGTAGAGVYLHGLAGDLACKEKGPVSLTAKDLIDKIPEAIKNVNKWNL